MVVRRAEVFGGTAKTAGETPALPKVSEERSMTTDPISVIRRARTTRLRAELRESFLMAVSALVGHKLRSALTLLGVTVGVFSIIVVMTAMRVLQANIEKELGQLGTHTFSIQKFPAFFVKDRKSVV